MAQGKSGTAVIVSLPCERPGCGEVISLTTRGHHYQRFCSKACYWATKYPKELYQSPIYRSWGDMKTRCTNPNWKQYKDYGGRGITVCERWTKFENFLEDMSSTWSEGMTLDRIDVNGDYTPENCRWATRLQQNQNKRNTLVRSK